MGRIAEPGLVPALRFGARREVARKLLHLASVAIPVFVWFVPPGLGRATLLAVTAVAIVSEFLRFHVRSIRHFFLTRTRHLLRRHEKRLPTGATYLAGSYAAAILLFPLPVAVLAMLYSGLGDGLAAVVGRRFGRHRLRPGKSLEGTAAILVVGLGVGLLIPGIPPLAAVAGALAAATLELAAIPPDDNIWVTLGGGSTVWLVIAMGA